MDYAEDPEPPNREADEWRRECETLRTALAARDRRIAFLETLFEEIDAINRRHEDAMNAANEYTREIRERVIAALATPPTKDEEGR